MGELSMELRRIIISIVIYGMSTGIILFAIVKIVELTHAWYWNY